jgi:pSer/pThr/pTyr-binding forkhead associated (FHA) protein
MLEPGDAPPTDDAVRHVAAAPSKSRQTSVEADDSVTPQPSPATPAASAPRGAEFLRRTIVEPTDAPPSGPAVGESSPEKKEDESAGAIPFRPTLRPPIAILHVMDDWGTAAETVRIRTDTFRIGRSDGDLLIPHDTQLSSEHMEIRRETKGKAWSWLLKDLASTNGLFVRVSQASLSDGQELILGGRRYCFRLARSEQPSRTNEKRGTIVAGRATPASGSATSVSGSARLEVVVAEGNPPCISLGGAEQWLGRDPARCDIALDDPMLGARDAKVFRKKENEWFIQSGKSLNGVWLRVEEMRISGRAAKFQCGEQRFELRCG